MTHQHLRKHSLRYLLLGWCVLSLFGCGSDSKNDKNEAPDAGEPPASGGTAGSSGTGGASGGTGGTQSGGSSGSNADMDASSDRGQSDGSAGGTTLALVAGTDFTTTEISTIDVGAGVVLGHASVPDGDAIPVASGGRSFVLERTNDIVHLLSDTGAIEYSLPLNDGDTGVSLNPHTVVVASNSQGDKGYVPLYEGNAIVVIDPIAGVEQTRIDLSSYLDAADTDGSVEADMGFYDPTTNRAYFDLQRIDFNTFPNLACPAAPSLLIGVDAATDSIVDINGSGAGDAVELSLVGPADIVFDAANNRALLVYNGCIENGVRVRHGIEAVNLTTGATSVLYDPTSQDLLNRLLAFSDGTLGVESFDMNYMTQVQMFQQSTGSLGAVLVDVPDFSVSETPGTLLGVSIAAGDAGAGADLVRYVISSGARSAVATGIWNGNFDFVSGVALVKP